MGVTLVGGGARSGKSRFALDFANERFTRRVWLATAEAGDDEMAARIAAHRKERGEEWTTIEQPFAIAAAIEDCKQAFDVVVVDCLTLWLSNLLLHEGSRPRDEIANLAAFVRGPGLPHIVLVTNEVGCGIVPENALAREYRDLAGTMNQRLARAADEVYWMVFGVPLEVKRPA